MTKRALIFGVGGQDGAYLAQLLLEKGYEVHGTSRDAEVSHFNGLRSLRIFDGVRLHSANLIDYRSVIGILQSVEPDEIYNLSAQSSVGLSFEQPTETVNSIVNATLNLLEGIRFTCRTARFYNASSGEVFGSTAERPADETAPFRPRSPYGVSKAAAHWLVQSYREAYGLFACSGILFNHESPLRGERFVTQKIVRAAVDIARGGQRRLHLGNLAVVRDWGWAPEYVRAMWLMLQQPEGRDYVIATGRGETLECFVERAFAAVDLDWSEHVDHDPALLRPYDVDLTVGDASSAAEHLGWVAEVRMPELVTRLIAAEQARRTYIGEREAE